MDKIFENKLFWYGLGVVGIIIFFYLLLQKIGLIRTSDEVVKDKKVDSIIFTPPTYTEPNYYKTISTKGRLLTETELKDISAIISDSFYGSGVSKWLFPNLSDAGTNEEKFFAGLKRVHSKVQFSQLIDFYNNEYKRDLHSDVISELDEDTELLRYFNYLESLPTTFTI